MSSITTDSTKNHEQLPVASAHTSPPAAATTAVAADVASPHPAGVSADTTSQQPPAATTTTTTTDEPPTDSVDGNAATEDTIPSSKSNDATPACTITLLLTSGARHPYKIDEKYLAKRNVNVPGTTESGRKDPFSISVYTLKELILREWREEWEAQPSSPSSIRLIHFGRLLDDKTPLSECRFNVDSPNVVHMTVKPQEMIDEEDASKDKSRGRDRGDGESTAGCRCVIL